MMMKGRKIVMKSSAGRVIWPGNTSIYCQFKLVNRSDKDRREPSQNFRGIADVKVHMKYFVRGADYFADNYLISY